MTSEEQKQIAAEISAHVALALNGRAKEKNGVWNKFKELFPTLILVFSALLAFIIRVEVSLYQFGSELSKIRSEVTSVSEAIKQNSNAIKSNSDATLRHVSVAERMLQQQQEEINRLRDRNERP